MSENADWLSSVGERDTVFQEMRRDARIESLIQNRKGKVLQLTGSFTETKNRQVNEACENLLTFNTFYKLNTILLNAVPYGIAACEVLWKFVDGFYIPYDFIPIPYTAMSFPRRVGIDFFTPVITQQNIIMDDERKFIVHRNTDGELSQYGKSVLQSAYTFWRLKNLGVEYWAKACQIVGCPSIVALFESKNENDARQRAKDLTDVLSEWESGSSGALGNVKDIKVISSTLNDFSTIVEACNTEIAYAITGQSLAVNEGQYGTRAQGTLHEITYDETIKGDAYLLQQTDQKLVNAFVELNFPGAVPPVYDIDSADFADFEVIRDCIDRGVPVSLKALYNKVHLPKPTDEKDSFVKAQPSFGFSDRGKDDFFQNRQ